ncbi:MAG: hypothetical protein OXJ64_06465 [Boseongicola sp.]|nr:hypothetical protein [Boseongicola sp.]
MIGADKEGGGLLEGDAVNAPCLAISVIGVKFTNMVNLKKSAAYMVPTVTFFSAVTVSAVGTWDFGG